MFIINTADTSKQYCAKTAMVLDILDSKHTTQKFCDDEIFRIFSVSVECRESEVIVIAGSEPMDKLDDLRSFLISARKTFNPENRPVIIIYTKYYMDELEEMGWSGVRCELLHYGNALLKYGRPLKNDKYFVFNKHLGIPLLGKYQNVCAYMGTRHS